MDTFPATPGMQGHLALPYSSPHTAPTVAANRPDFGQVHIRQAMPDTGFDLVQALSTEVRGLKEQIQVLETRARSNPTRREEDLEMTLSLVWEGLCRSGSREAQSEGPLWRVMRRNAPEILRNAPEPAYTQIQNALFQSGAGPIVHPLFDFSQGQSIQNFDYVPKASDNPDSGYGAPSGANMFPGGGSVQ